MEEARVDTGSAPSDEGRPEETRKKPGTSRYHDTLGAAEYLNLSESFLAKARVAGDGPPFMKFGRRVLYSEDDLDIWARSRRRLSTSQAVKA